MATYNIKAGSSWNDNNYKPGDILNFSGGTYGYFSGANLNGTPDNPIQFLFGSGAKFTAGFNLTNSSNIFIDGGSNKNLLLQTDNRNSGVPLCFQGKCSNIHIRGFILRNSWSGVWFKTEPNDAQFANWNHWVKSGNTIVPAYVMDGLTLEEFESDDMNFETFYIGGTGQLADRPVTIDGITYYPYPHKVRNIRISNGTITGSARTGAQVSGLDAEGESYIRNVSIKNSGLSKEANQGASFRLGGRSTNFEISGCTFDGSNLYNVHSQGGGIIKFTNNKVLNSNKINGVVNAIKMAAVEFDTFKDNPATLIIAGNEIDESNNGVSVVVYPDKNGGGVNTDSIFSNNKLAGSFQNFSGVEFKEDATEPTEPTDPMPPTPEEVILKNVVHTFNYSDGTKKEVKACQYVARIKDSNWLAVHNDGTTEVIPKIKQ